MYNCHFKVLAAILFLAAAIAACEPFDTISGTPRDQPGQPEEEIRESNLDEHIDTVIYLAALEFESGYDWSKDSVLRDIPATAVLLKKDPLKKTISRIAEFSAGIAAAPDALFLSDGHLYGISARDGQRIVSEDGTERFRWVGNERVEGLYATSDTIATLGITPGGFCFRINGEEVISRPGGSIIHGLHVDGNACIFFYEVPDEEVGRRVYHRFKVVNGREEELSVNSMGAIYDMMMVNGKMCILSRLNARVGMRISIDKQITSLKRSVTVAADIRLLRAGETVYVSMEDVAAYPQTKTLLWGPDGTHYLEEGTISFFPDTFRTGAAGRVGLIRLTGDGQVTSFGMMAQDESGWEQSPSAGSRLLSRDCAACAGGTLFAAFSRTGAPPQLWTGRTVHDLPVTNGYITAIDVSLIKK